MNDVFIAALMIAGALLILIASIGLLRFKDLYSRIHAATKATSLGILLLLIGVIIYFKVLDITLKSILIVVFIYITSPLAAHSIAKSFRDSSDETDTEK
ncbi:monovalent cation/H(+) antiporter subunit G [Plebeiibacterium marinum]|uniref:Monovalent cation/H(+) antiporter subunit G n=1 Tax=Plebeiibacterium marinum TaxID=2992111 RepID=A0AAE3MBU1_9BACT|nr:monovalent cation/H(+) antiporter subunit G [Plebeiobacterium marinum]MCW3804724.1 monovalent cation/H(+) antiporter subunit G [Plebeiobacterium marinum]